MGLDSFYDIAPNGKKIFFGTAYPSAASDGTFSAGDRVIYNGSTTQAPAGWICTASGTPGTWEAISDTFTVDLTTIAGAAAADFDGSMKIAPYAGKLVSFVERHGVAGSDPSAAMMLVKAASGTAKGSGTDMLAAVMDMSTSANTNRSGTLHGTAANLLVAAGDAITLVGSGTLTALDAVCTQAKFLRLS